MTPSPTPSRSALALFDFDGTITTLETMPVFLRRSIPRHRLVLGWIVLAPLILAYRLRLVPGTFVRRVVVWFGYAGLSRSAVGAAGEAFARDYLPTVLRPEAMERLAWHKEQGHRVVVVSGGLDVYLAPWCKAAGVELLGSSLLSRGGILTGRYSGRQCVRDEKVRRVRKLCDLHAYPVIYAYGDTPEDHAMLAIADRTYYQWRELGPAR